MKLSSLFIAGALAATPLTVALAQGTTGPGIKADSASGIAAEKEGAANTHTQGATGTTTVPGNKSTVASDRKATYEEKVGQSGAK